MDSSLEPYRALVLDKQLCFALHSTSLAMTKTYKPLLQKMGLTYPQYLAMLVLWETDGLSVGDISARLLTDPGSLTPLLKRLEAQGLLQRNRSKADERVVTLRLTAKGRALHEQAKAIPGCILQSTDMPMAQLDEIKQALITLRKHLYQSLDAN